MVLEGYYDDSGRYWGIFERGPEDSDEILFPTPDYHAFLERQKIPSVTTLAHMDKACGKSVWISYNVPVFRHFMDFFYMTRGRLIHANLLKRVMFKEMLMFYRPPKMDIPVVGCMDGFEDPTIFEIKTVSTLPKKDVVPEDHIFQQSCYHWMAEKNGLVTDKTIWYYVTWWSFSKITLPKSRIMASAPENFDEFLADRGLLFNDYVYARKKTTDLSHCMSCAYWNICSEGKETVIAEFKTKGELPMNHPCWIKKDVEDIMAKDKVYRSKLLVQNYALLNKKKK